MLPEKNKYVFWVFIIASVVLRFYTFFPGVIDHDESTYLIIGRDLIEGKQLYVNVTDTKPVGIFLIYAFFHYIFGYSIFLPRLFVSLLIGFTSYLLFLVSLKLVKERTAAFAAGMIYVFYTSIWSQFGMSPNTEQFFNVTTIAALLFFLKDKKWSYTLAGLLFGIGFIIKYLVLFDFVFLSAFFLIRELFLNKWRIGKVDLIKYFLAGIGFSLPFLLTNLYFYLGNNFEAFKYITYELPGKYGEDPEGLKYIVLLLDFIGRFLPISFMFFYVLFSKNNVLQKWQVQMFLVWIAGILIAMYLPGKGFDHYTIQLMIPFSLVAGMFFHPAISKNRYMAFVFGKKYGPVFLLAFVIIVEVLGISGIFAKKDSPRKIASYLEKKMDKDDTVYLSNYKHVVYYLLRKDCPTKYVHPTLLTNPEHARALGIDGAKEIKRIIDTKPTYIVVYMENELVEGLIKSNYKTDTIFWDGIVKIYKREK